MVKFSFAASLLVAARIVQSAAQSSYGNLKLDTTRRYLFDGDGNQVDAYRFNINFYNGSYVIIGLSTKNTTSGDPGNPYYYKTNDFVNYTSAGPALTVSGEPSSAQSIIYNNATNKWVAYGGANGGVSSGYEVSTADSPLGPWTPAGFVQPPANALPEGHIAADFSVWSNGSAAWLSFSSLTFADPRTGSLWPVLYQNNWLAQLTDNFTNITGSAYPVRSSANDLVDNQLESPASFIRNGIHYVIGSNTCGFCNGSLTVAYRSSDWQSGNWTRQILSGDSCGGQVENITPIPQEDGDYAYLWHATTLPGGPRVAWSGHIFQPLVFNEDGSLQDIQCGATSSDLTVVNSARVGGVVLAGGKIAASSDSAPQYEAYTPVCNNDNRQVIQTWTNSKSGNLTEVGVNIARNIQSVNLTLIVFKFSNDSALISPGYRWEILGTQLFTPEQLDWSFGVAKVPCNGTVASGDRLGVQIVSGLNQAFAPDVYAPYCHLQTNSSDSTRTMYGQGLGQNSPRGANGMASPVYEMPGQQLKFYSSVE